jgi:hypothetical protein
LPDAAPPLPRERPDGGRGPGPQPAQLEHEMRSGVEVAGGWKFDEQNDQH